MFHVEHSPIGFDCETHLIVRGRVAPRLVCLTLAGHGAPPGWVLEARDAKVVPRASRWTALLGRVGTLDVLPGLLEYPGDLVAHTAVYDLAVLAEHWRTTLGQDDPDWAVRQIFRRLRAGTVADTQVREKLIRLALGEFEFSTGQHRNIRTLYGLGDLVKRYFNASFDDSKKPKTKTLNPGDDLPEAAATRDLAAPWRLRYYQLDGVPVSDWPASAVDYAVGDAVWALDVHQAQTSATPENVAGLPLHGGGKVVGQDRELRAAWALHLQAAWGMRCDPEAVLKTTSSWAAMAAQGRALAEEEGWVRIKGRDKGKPGSVIKHRLQAAVEAACLVGGIPVPRTGPTETYPKGQVQYGEEHLRRAGEAEAVAAGTPIEEHPLVRYAETLTLAGYNAKYAKVLALGGVWPVTSRPNHLVATGRTSWADPQYQQPPQKGGFREAHVPSPGFWFVSVDYDTIELVALAQICLWLGYGSAMADAIRAGQDLHCEMAAALLAEEGHMLPDDGDDTFDLLGEERGDWTGELVQDCLGGKFGPDWVGVAKHRRSLAKIANFGFPGGQGPRSLAENARKRGVDLSVEGATRLKALWRRRWPEMDAYLARVARATAMGATFVAQQAVSGRLRGDCGYTDGCNTYFQGLVADGAKAAAFALAEEAYTGDGPFAGCRPVLFLHDEVLAEVPIERASEAAEAMTSIMIDVMQEHIPDIPISAKPALMRRWYKNAEPAYDKGQLVPWEPT